MLASKKLTREEYNQLTPKQRGYASYMQAEWNRNLPRRNPFEPGTQEHRDWDEGERVAVLEVQDYDDC